MVNSPNQDEVFAIRGKLWQNGFRPVSVFSPDAIEWTGKTIDNAGKRPKGEHWTDRARSNPPEASTKNPSTDAFNTGILCDGLVALDLDIDDAALSQQVAGAAIHFLGNAPTRIRSDSARVLMLYRASEGEPSKRSVKGTHGKVEALGYGQQFVAFGQHPSGAAYAWPQGSPADFHRDALTPVTQDALQGFLCAVAPLVGADTPAQPLTSPAGLPVAPVATQVTDRDRAYGDSVLRDECAMLAAMVAGMGRNDQLNISAHSTGTLVGNGSIDGETARRDLLIAATTNGHAAKHGVAQTKATIESGLKAGIEKPRSLLTSETPDINISAMVENGIAAYKSKHSQAAPANGKRAVTVVQGSQIEAQKIDWLWEGYLPSGKLTLLAGAGGTGKSTIAFNLAATITNGGIWPDGSRCNVAGNVLIWSSEDDPADTIKPRLMAVGANENRYGVISGTIDAQGLRTPFDAAQDMDELRVAALRIGGISMLIIDPIITAVTALSRGVTGARTRSA